MAHETIKIIGNTMKNTKKAMTFLMTHEFDLLWDFNGVQEKAFSNSLIIHVLMTQSACIN